MSFEFTCQGQKRSSATPSKPVNDSIISVNVDNIKDFVEAMNFVVADLYRENNRIEKFYSDKEVFYSNKTKQDEKLFHPVRKLKFVFKEKDSLHI